MEEKPSNAPHGRVCMDCKWWNAGECRRLPPSWASWPYDNQHPIMYMPQASWPHVNPTDWCGEWRGARG